MKHESLINRINSPEKLKALPFSSLPVLAGEIRERIIDVITRNGGHLASNLGVVELTIALHRVFDSPSDKIVWDVGHQCYTHKILTGRNESFETIRLKNGLSGFPKRDESVHDIVETGHASTSVSAALGILAGERLRGKSGKVVAVIGDGALTGGIAYEAMNHAGHLRKDLIIIYNDNNMSIGENVGGLSSRSGISRSSSYVSRITATRSYQRIRDRIDRGLLGIPLLGFKIFQLVMRLKRGVKAVFLKETIFSELGFEYVGPIDGHSLSMLVKVLQNVKKLHKPVVVHVVTQKGKGYLKAEENPSAYHGVSPLPSPKDRNAVAKNSFSSVLGKLTLAAAEKNSKVTAVVAAMADGTGLSGFYRKFPERFFDVGIAEQHAVTFGAGLAASGLKPVVAIYSTFMQRAVDQVIHDIALPGLPVVIAMDRSGLVSSDGETHQGVYDISLFRSVPGLTMLSPGSAEEFSIMMKYALDLEAPVLLRYPKAVCPEGIEGLEKPIQEGRGVFTGGRQSSDILLMTVGGLIPESLNARKILHQHGIGVDIYNIRFIKPVDEDYLAEVMGSYTHILFIEEGAINGGIGEYISKFIIENQLDILYRHIGIPDEFISQGLRDELLTECGLDGPGIASAVMNFTGIRAMKKVLPAI